MGQQITARDGVKLELHEWLVDDPRITILLVHGYAEHCRRYDHVAKAWNARGIQVVGADLRGHGKSEGGRGFVERFEDYHRDIDALMDAAKARAKGSPIAIYGHSNGGLIALHWLLAGNGHDLAGVILTSPFLGLALKPNPVKVAAGRVMAKILPKIGLPSGFSGKDVCADETIQRAYDTDPLIFKNVNARWFSEAMSAMALVHARAGELKTPMLLLYGGSDKLASADETDRFARGLRMEQLTKERLVQHAHELVNEGPPAREKVIARMGDWILSRAEARAA
jgi:alpha-beta hydrolase superfamily lysophospholipase